MHRSSWSVVPTCRALPLVSMGSVTAEMAQMMHTEEKRHRAPVKEALMRTCRPKNIKQELTGVGAGTSLAIKSAQRVTNA